ncbi:hypothetical protein Q5P01_023577 [Channa striata]|uniref:Uncharacterized protein n=1 Tax=Channa striata TaxID=64152 RepID=A0AA88J6G3_CHASR|nr:hypothetical protein Q5P01_023577 [Channa striata]
MDGRSEVSPCSSRGPERTVQRGEIQTDREGTLKAKDPIRLSTIYFIPFALCQQKNHGKRSPVLSPCAECASACLYNPTLDSSTSFAKLC